ncbi:hypothetical protein SP3_00006 [Bacillus phage fHSPT3]
MKTTKTIYIVTKTIFTINCAVSAFLVITLFKTYDGGQITHDPFFMLLLLSLCVSAVLCAVLLTMIKIWIDLEILD